MIRFEALRARYLDDTALGSTGAVPAIARSLEHIGWRSVRDPSPEALAGYLVELFDACVHHDRDVLALTHGIAGVLHETGPFLDGGLPPVEAYLPAAEDILRLYVENRTGSPSFTME